MRRSYDFRLEGRVVGSYELEDAGGELRQQVAFEQPDGERYRDEHVVRYRDGRPIAYRSGDTGWTSLDDAPEDHWPTAAYPLLLRARRTAYIAIDEGTGATTARTHEHLEDRVIEREDDRITRVFELRDGEVVHIDWGGATSTLQPPHA